MMKVTLQDIYVENIIHFFSQIMHMHTHIKVLRFVSVKFTTRKSWHSVQKRRAAHME